MEADDDYDYGNYGDGYGDYEYDQEGGDGYGDYLTTEGAYNQEDEYAYDDDIYADDPSKKEDKNKAIGTKAYRSENTENILSKIISMFT